MRLWRRRRRTDVPDDRSGLVVAYWESHDEHLLTAGLGTIARRLPSLVAAALRMAWQANPRDTAVALAGNLVAGVFTVFGLVATSDVLASLLAAGPTPERVRAALPSLLLVAAATGLRGALLAGAGWAQARLKPQVERLAETRLFELTTQVELAAFDDHDFHNAMRRARDSGVPDTATVVETTIAVVTGAVGVLASAVALGLLHPILMPLLLVTAVPAGWAAVRTARLGYQAFYRLSTARRRKFMLSDLMAERQPAAEVRAFTLRDFLLGQYGKVADLEQDVQLDVARRQAAVKASGDLLTGVATAGVYVVLGVLLAVGVIPLSVAGAAVLAIRTGQVSLTALVQTMNRLYEAGLYFGDYLAFCELARERIPAPPLPAAAAEPAPFRRLTAEHVTFTYPGADRPALSDVSVTLGRGEVVALVGENGSGKTTLAKLLAGLYRPQHGTIHWDGVDLDAFDGETLRRSISVIAQDHTRWPLTVRENIVMGRPPEDDRLAAACAAAGADEVVAGLAGGYDALLDRRFRGGHDLSGGQWQRIAVARGFYRDAALVIFDEPTSALDARAEHALFERIRGHAEGRTIVLITHRLASVRYADRIYVLDHGTVAEQGTHAELMAREGLYADLYELQASAYRQRVP
ncbi:ATP-binding cassette subfamily B protein/ATP-binding cassette subfamily C protein [Nonomuraea muscovyensis]|uniref:ATP-binding cassette subfamily B protein/ATP-binding cassette subfamily C protein n=1 Tax=Nonomuraea muscovyensis TaxID=1124761 RepID=A0A7X0EYM4_9ACTN|nr:ABC transporter ATP-binding protein [Nonomuraea muscovyensis]MBB6345935.1 ATP-binding cassette subfamily B protein/ATP-binding cassette subfamily C protein [Nonomuraea muscovyensis]